MKRTLALLALVCALAAPAWADIKFPLNSSPAPPNCTVAQLLALSGPCAALSPADGADLAIVTDSIGDSCTIGGGSRKVACNYNEEFAAWVPVGGIGATDEGGDIIDVDPSAAGTWTAGIQEAVNKCNSAAGRCTVKLRCDTEYAFAARASWDDSSAVNLTGKDDITIEGCGPSSIVSYTGSTLAATAFSYMFLANEDFSANNVERIKFKNFTLRWTEQCTTGCATGTKALIGLIRVSDVEISDMIIESSLVANDGTIGTTLVDVSGYTGWTPDRMSKRVSIHDNTLRVATNGVVLSGCDDCAVEKNQIDFSGRPTNDASPIASTGVWVVRGNGVRVLGNGIDVSSNGDTSTGSRIYGMQLFGDTAVSPMPITAEGAVVAGNTIRGMRQDRDRGVGIIGYTGAVITDNTFTAGFCSAVTTRSCNADEDCADVGGSCSAAQANGVIINAEYNVNAPAWGRGNLVENNGFNNFDESGTSCPFSVIDNNAAGASALDGTQNTFRNNSLILSDTAEDGVCGDATKLAANHIYGNSVLGASGLCVAGGSSTSCALSVTDGQVVAGNLGLELLESDTNPPCSTGNYAIYADASETAIKKCTNGVLSDLAGGGTTTTLTADSGGTTTGTPVTLAGGALVDTTRSGDTVTVSVDFTEIGSGVTLGDNSQSAITLTFDVAGIANPFVRASDTGITIDGSLNGITLNAGVLGAITLSAPTGDAGTVLPTASIGAGELDANSVTASELADDAVDVAAINASGTPSASTYLRGDMSWQTPAGSGDVTAVGPACFSGDCLTDGIVTSGTTLFVFEGTTDNTSELSLLSPTADPGTDVNITLPSTTGTLVGTGDTGTVTLGMHAANSVDTSKVVDGSLTFDDLDQSNTLTDASGMDANEVSFGVNGFVFEGSTADASEGFLTPAGLSGDRTWTLPNADASLIGTQQIDASAELLVIVGDETGTGALVFGTGPTIGTPNLTGALDWNDVPVSDDDCTGQIGEVWFDDTDNAFEFCQANSGVPTILGGTGAPTGSEYLVSAADATLSNEDVVTEGLAIDYTNGAGTGTFSFDPTELIGTTTFGAGAAQTWVANTGVDPDPQIDWLDGGIVINEAGADLDLRMEGDTDPNLFVLDAGLDSIGIGRVPGAGYKLDVQGTVRSSDGFESGDKTTEPGNRFQLNDNDTAFTNDPACANSGTAGLLTIIDKDETASENWVVCDGTTELGPLSALGSAGAPTTADYLVGTANGSLSAEIVVGTSPGGELGGTWASPTIDDSLTVTGWDLGASVATTPGVNDNDTSLATTAYAQSELTAYASDTATFTNKTYDVAGTGNVFTTEDVIPLPLVACQNTTATLLLDTVGATGPAASCSAGSTNTGLIRGVASFDAATDEAVQVQLPLPSTWSGAVDVRLKWRAAATTGDVIWATQTVCVADAEVDDAAWNTQDAFPADTAKGTTLQTNDASDTSITTTGCAAGESLHLRIFRDADAGGDTMTGDADLISAEVTIRRTL